jgi:hypothetical protein
MGSETKVRVPVSHFAESSNGTLYVAHGDRPVKYWDGFASGFVNAGVSAPTTKPVVASSGTGILVGEYYAYVRFLDSRGNVSNLSPISDVHAISITTGTITNATNASPIKITSTTHGLSTGARIKVYGVLGNAGANGTFVVTSVDANTFTLDDSRGTGDYVAGGNWDSGASRIDYSSIEVPTDSRVVKRQILRNRDGNLNTFYVDVTDTTLVGTTFTSTKTDVQLTDEVPLSSDDGTDLNVGRHGAPPNHKRVIVNHFSRLFAAVDLIYTVGAVSVTNGSATVTGIATGFTVEMKGRRFYPNGSNNTTNYLISAVDVPNQTLTLSVVYAGTTDPYMTYAVAPDDSERLAVRYSEAGLPESWDPLSLIKTTPDPGSGKMTGLMSLGTNLNLLFEHRIFSLAYVSNPLKDGQLRRTAWRGCLNQHCFQLVGETAFIMDREGVYVFDGQSVSDISGMIQPLFGGTNEWSLNRLSFEHAHSVYSPLEKTIRWFVCLGGYRYPRHALAFHQEHRRWWVEEYEHPVPASHRGNIANKRRVLLGMDSRRVAASKVTPLDGPSKDDTRVRSTATGSSLIAIDDIGNNFSGMDYLGMPIQIVTGTGAGQSRIIVKVEGTKLTVNYAWNTLPDATSVYQIGGVRWKYRTARMRWVVDYEGTKSVRGYEVGFEPLSNSSTMIVRKFANYDSVAEEMEYDRSLSEGDGVSTEAGSADMLIDLKDTTGAVYQSLDDYIAPRSKANHLFRLELEGIPNNERHKLYEITVDGVQ